MSAEDARYPDIGVRRRRVARVRRDLLKYLEALEEHKSWYYSWDATASEDERARDLLRRQYYELIQACVGTLPETVGLLQAERRIKAEVMPNLTKAQGLGVHRVWFLYEKTVENIDAYVKQWFGEQTKDKELRGLVSFELYQICEYRHRDAYHLAGLKALKKECYEAYEWVWAVSTSPVLHQQEMTARVMWRVQAAREAFAAAVAGAAATATNTDTRAAAEEVEELLDAVMKALGELVEALEQAGSAAAVVEAAAGELVEALEQAGSAAAVVEAAAPEEGEQLEVLHTEKGVGKFGDTHVYQIKKDRRTGEVREYRNGKPGKVLHDYQGARLAGLLRQLQACS
jgi:hypothetical protein